MPRQNRVMPDGSIVAVADRGTLMGNRGVLHDAAGRLGPARWRHRRWVACVLDFRGRWRPVMAPGRYTELFFLDEAVALAAGHRPCAECRRDDYDRWRAAWARAFGAAVGADAMDRVLHADRTAAAPRRADLGGLPDGAFVRLDAETGDWLVWGPRLWRHTPGGYGADRPRGAGDARVLTPAATLAVLAAGYRPVPHPSGPGAQLSCPPPGGVV